jgi:hypothetical protein
MSRLPIELLEQCISAHWSSVLSVEERVYFMTTSLLVSKAWLVAFTRVSSKNVHIPCASYADQYLRLLREESPIYDEQTKALPDLLCHSMTFHIQPYPATHLPSDHDVHQIGCTLSNTLYAIDTLRYVPNLRQVAIEYTDFPFDDLFDEYRLVPFPSQVTHLEVNHSFDSCTPSWLVSALREQPPRRECLQWSLPSVRHLSVSGSGDAIITDLMSACPNVETVATDVSLLDLPHTPLRACSGS